MKIYVDFLKCTHPAFYFWVRHWPCVRACAQSAGMDCKVDVNLVTATGTWTVKVVRFQLARHFIFCIFPQRYYLSYFHHGRKGVGTNLGSAIAKNKNKWRKKRVWYSLRHLVHGVTRLNIFSRTRHEKAYLFHRRDASQTEDGVWQKKLGSCFCW